MSKIISEDEIIAFQEAWGNAVVTIGKLFSEQKSYVQYAKNLVSEFYGYEEGKVLFKPTKAKQKQFRLTKEGALSYFIGDNPEFEEDKGFALQPWTNVRFENAEIFIQKHEAFAMGNYYFTDNNGAEIKVEYTLGIFRNALGSLKVNLHHSSLPYREN